MTYLVGGGGGSQSFRFNLVQWLVLYVRVGCSELFLPDIVHTFGFSKCVSVPTRGDDILDLLLCNAPVSVGNVRAVPATSDSKNFVWALHALSVVIAALTQHERLFYMTRVITVALFRV